MKDKTRDAETGGEPDEPRGADPRADGEEPVAIVPIGPELDLHSFRPRDIPSVVDEYLSAAHEEGLRRVRIVHGRGRGVQRGIVQSLLERHPLVAEFDDDGASHLGATLVILRNA